MKIELLTKNNIKEESILNFNRTQQVNEVYLKKNDRLILTKKEFVDDWNTTRRKEIARSLIDDNHISYGVFAEKLLGFISLRKNPIEDYVILDMFHVDKYYRHRGIGKNLFLKAVLIARNTKAKALYISACSSKDTIAAYMALGCILAPTSIKEFSEDEPFDIPLIYEL